MCRFLKSEIIDRNLRNFRKVIKDVQLVNSLILMSCQPYMITSVREKEQRKQEHHHQQQEHQEQLKNNSNYNNDKKRKCIISIDLLLKQHLSPLEKTPKKTTTTTTKTKTLEHKTNIGTKQKTFTWTKNWNKNGRLDLPEQPKYTLNDVNNQMLYILRSQICYCPYNINKLEVDSMHVCNRLRLCHPVWRRPRW